MSITTRVLVGEGGGSVKVGAAVGVWGEGVTGVSEGGGVNVGEGVTGVAVKVDVCIGVVVRVAVGETGSAVVGTMVGGCVVAVKVGMGVLEGVADAMCVRVGVAVLTNVLVGTLGT